MNTPEAGSPVLIVRLSTISDVVVTSPLIHALRLCCPSVRICWLVQAESMALQDSVGDATRIIQEAINGNREVRVFGGEDYESSASMRSITGSGTTT